MLEQLRMQEVAQIILSVPKGAEIPGKNYSVGEPVMIINRPALSSLSFVSKPAVAEDAQGHISTSGITKNIEFIINDGAVLYSLWSYIYGLNEKPQTQQLFKGTEEIRLDDQKQAWLSKKAETMYLYDSDNNLIPTAKYYGIQKDGKYGICLESAKEGDTLLAVYNYLETASTVSKIKQIHNNIFCAMDIYIDATDLQGDEKHTVYVHCDKVQVDTDLILSINDSSKASFTPIRIKSIAEGDGIDKEVATIMVV